MGQNKNSFKLLSAALLAGCAIAGFGGCAFADELADAEAANSIVLGDEDSLNLLKNKPADAPTLDYLKNNKVVIPQKTFKYDNYGYILKENGKPVYDEEKAYTIMSPESAYKIVEGSEANHDFEVQTADKDGNVTTNYYNVELHLDKQINKTPTLDNLKKNMVKISQKVFKRDENGKVVIQNYLPSYDETASVTIDAPDSAYKIVDGTEQEHVFEYKTVDKNGNIITQYYNIELRNSEQIEDSLKFGKSKNVAWAELSEQPAEGSKNVVTVQLPNDETKYYQYTLKKDYSQSDYNKVYDDAATSEHANTSYYDMGGALKVKDGETTKITDALFINNKSVSTEEGDKPLRGGAIFNEGTIEEIKADFINNTADSNGGAICNNWLTEPRGVIGDITGDFIGNKAGASGGAIHNAVYAEIGNITGDFVGNTAQNYGGAIGNLGTILDITGDFIGNKAGASGGAISNDYNARGAKIGNITGDFIGNSAKDNGGAIYNYYKSEIGDITGNFIGNSAERQGGALFNSAGSTKIGDITGNFIGNTAGSDGGAMCNNYQFEIGNITGNFIGNTANGVGGALYFNNQGVVGDITGDFIGNTANGNGGGAIYNYSQVSISNITGNFIGNTTSGDGGAIYNNSSDIGIITGDFIGNTAVGGRYYYGGGAIFNSNGRIAGIIGDFIGNTAVTGSGGAIDNSSNSVIGDITGNFIKNVSGRFGGAIYTENGGRIKNVTGDFIDNTAASAGGAIGVFYGSNMGDVTGNFIGNTATMETLGASNLGGGAIKVDSGCTIGNIIGDFIANTSGTNGGAIGLSSGSSIQSITGRFVSNTATVGSGGAIHVIYNGSNIKDITGDFVNNTAGTSGGAVHIETGTTIGNLTGDFVNNNAGISGGAISAYQGGKIGIITGNLINNTAMQGSGGAINLSIGCTADNITANFVGNKAATNGGAIYMENGSTIGAKEGNTVVGGLINSNFYNNSVIAAADAAIPHGGAIWKNMPLNIIADNGSSTFKGNYVQVGDGEKNYNAIYLGNTAPLSLIARNGGVISMYDNIDGVTAQVAQKDAEGNNLTDAEGNTVYEETHYTVNITGDTTGTVNLYNDIKNGNVAVDSVKVNFADNNTHNYELQSLSSDDSAKYVIDVDLANEKSDKITTLSDSNGTVTIDSLRILNELTSIPKETVVIQVLDTQTDDLQLALSQKADVDEYKLGVSVETVLDEIKAATSFDDKYSIYDQETDIYGRLELATTDTTNDSIGISVSRTEGGKLVYRESQGDTLALWNGLDTDEVKNFNFKSGTDVYTVGKDNPETLGLGETRGSELNVNGVISPNGERSTINFNNREGFEVVEQTTLNANNVTLTNAHAEKGSVINVADSNSTVNLTNVNLVNNTSSGEGGAIYSNSDVNITANGASSVISNNYSNGKYEAVYLENPDKTLSLKSLNNGVIVLDDSINGKKGYAVDITGDGSGTVVLNNDINNANVTIGNVNLNTANNVVHTYNYDSLTLTGNVNASVDVDLANTVMDRFTADTYGKHQGTLNVVGMNMLSDAKDDVTSILFADQGLKDNVTTSVSEVAYSPIYKYGVSYDNRGDGGYFLFTRGGAKTGNASDSFNPAVLSSPVSTQTGSQSALNQTVHLAFQHSDLFSQMPYYERMAIINQNKYAVQDVVPRYNSNFEQLDRGYWFKPFTSFESINLHQGPSVNAITYGTLFGYDSNFHEHKHGWYDVQTVYAGYVGSQMEHPGVHSSMNGGLLGLTETFYKGNFFGALTATVGATMSDSSTMYGKEDYTSLQSGVGIKTGYNFEFKNGKYILQPALLTNYSFVNTFDYTNAANVRMKSDPSHTIQVNPQLKFVANLKNGWQPYASVGVVWNVLNRSKVQANEVILPKMSVDPYVEYGVGLQRSWKDRFTGYLQAMVRNGGRNGVALTFGFRWALGKDNL